VNLRKDHYCVSYSVRKMVNAMGRVRLVAVVQVDRDRAARRPTPSGGGRVYIR